MDKFYYDTVDSMEKKGVDKDYMLGWMGGYMQAPKREEQRVNEAYDAGYEDGESKETGNMDNWATS